MIGEGIHDGDWVVVARRERARPGEMVVALLGDEVTLKRYFPKGLGSKDDAMKRHRLRREIIATVVANEMINIAGATFPERLRDQLQQPLPGHFIFTDVEGNRYEIPSLAALDPHSRRLLDEQM